MLSEIGPIEDVQSSDLIYYGFRPFRFDINEDGSNLPYTCLEGTQVFIPDRDGDPRIIGRSQNWLFFGGERNVNGFWSLSIHEGIDGSYQIRAENLPYPVIIEHPHGTTYCPAHSTTVVNLGAP